MLDAREQALFQQALALHQQMKLDDAARIYRGLLSAHPDHSDLLQLQGVLAFQRGDPGQAVELMQRSLRLNAAQPNVLANLGNALAALGRTEEAIVKLSEAIALNPNYAEAFSNRGTLLSALKQHERALADFDEAVRLKPDFADAWLGRGNTLKDLRRTEDAVNSYRRATTLAPARADANNNLGVALLELGRWDDALAAFRHAVSLAPAFTDAIVNVASTLRLLRRYDEALPAFRAALARDPNVAFLAGAYLHTRQHVCDWENLEADIQGLLADVDAGKPVATPFNLVALPATPEQQRRCASTFAAIRCPPSPKPVWSGAPYDHKKIRVGYFSADFHDHATAYLMAGLIEQHDRSRFDVKGYTWGAFEPGTTRSRLEMAFGGLIDLQSLSDRDAATLARSDEIDIAVDLKGFTNESRPGIFACRPAPIQVSYLGFPGTMGVDYIDYLVADTVVIPPDAARHYSEQIVYMPDSYQVNDRHRAVSARHFTRAELGLPETGFVFCSFNSSYKISPALFDIWMRLVQGVPGSVLWLHKRDDLAAVHLKREAEKRGVDGNRLVFAAHMPAADHLARHRAADLFLDTLWCNGHTTTSDALWMNGLVVTCPGATFASRVSASLLSAVGLSELIAPDAQAYESLALDLARSPSRRAALTAKREGGRLSQPLFDTDRFTRHLEAAYTEMWARHRRGEQPGRIIIGPRG